MAVLNDPGLTFLLLLFVGLPLLLTAMFYVREQVQAFGDRRLRLRIEQEKTKRVELEAAARKAEAEAAAITQWLPPGRRVPQTTDE
jgi:hypothetical protein